MSIPGLIQEAGRLLNAGIKASGPAFDAYFQQQNVDMQREFARNGIQWRVEDAKKAGISPLAALGAQTTSFQPQQVYGDDDDGLNIGEALDFAGRMGQNISRAAKAASSKSTRQKLEMNELNLEQARLKNKLLDSQIHVIQQNQLGPPQPEEAVKPPDVTYTRTKSGGLAPVPSEGFADRAEDQLIPQLMWGMRNMVIPRNPEQSPGPGRVWSYNPGRGEFESVTPPARWWISPRSTYDSFRNWMNHE